ncbi:hypothetical protein BN1263430027 [Stenotrophomonas indicatrix]|nr:hypothetical protein BN1263430027 [Stenotrophomonas indicatrix]
MSLRRYAGSRSAPSSLGPIITACFRGTNTELEAFEDWFAASGVHDFALNSALILAAPHSNLGRSVSVDSARDVGTCLRSLWRSNSYTLIFIGNFDNASLGPPCRTLCECLALRLAPARLLL